MTAIAGIARGGEVNLVNQMLDEMAYRGGAGREVVETSRATLGILWSRADRKKRIRQSESILVEDSTGVGRLARACLQDTNLLLERDSLGKAPLYYGMDDQGTISFSSEVKGLLVSTEDVHEMPPGAVWRDGEIQTAHVLELMNPLDEKPVSIARELRRRLEESIAACLHCGEIGSWLSGGLDSSAIAALARPHFNQFHTFAVGLAGAPDLHYAGIAADYLGTIHHELLVDTDDLLKVLPEMIHHLESFDALLVRSSMTNYLVGKLAADYVPAVFSGEGGDELFAGYEYLHDMEITDLPAELVDITKRLHSTALQRVDRCSMAHGMAAFTPFLAPAVVNYALQIPPQYKIYKGVEKWILRKAVEDLLPPEITFRKKAKFWEGAGVTDLLAEAAEKEVTTSDFAKKRYLPNGWILNSKEELLYYRIFSEWFGDAGDLHWMGRTKGAPMN